MTTRRDDPSVMVVEDDDEIRESLAEMFTGRGYRALGVATPHRAFELLERGWRPRVIVLDPFTPNDARGFQSKLAANPIWATIPTIVGPGTSPASDAIVGPRHTHVLSKPLNLRHLFDILGRYCSTRSLRC
jgi:DNA-binding NtrC family response regulator